MQHLKNYDYQDGIYKLIFENDEDNTSKIVICEKQLIFMDNNMPYIALKSKNNDFFIFKFNKFCEPTNNIEKVLLYELTDTTYKKVFKTFEQAAINYPDFREFISEEVLKTIPEPIILSEQEMIEWQKEIEVEDEKDGIDFVDEIIEHKKRPLKISKASTIVVDFLLFICISFGLFFLFKITNKNTETKPEVIISEEKEKEEVEEEYSSEENVIENNNIIIQEGNIIKYEGEMAVYDVSLIVEESMPSIVSILSQTQEEKELSNMYNTKVGGSGSGIIIGKNETELLIATNYHLIDSSDLITVTFSQDLDNKYSVAAQIKGSDENNDLCILSIKIKDIHKDMLEEIKIAVIGDSTTIKLGEPVIAIGNACGYGPSVTTGVVSAINRKIGSDGPYIQTDAAINPGNSGGALINKNGEVIGINCSKLSDESIEGIGYAIPSSTFNPIVSDLSKLETRERVKESDRGYLGILGVEVSTEANIKYGMPLGAFVSDILDGGAASKSLLQENDIIVKINDKQISNMKQLQNELCYYKKGETVVLTVKRFVVDSYDDIEIIVKLQPQVNQ